MKTIIAGSRDCYDYSLLLKAIEEISWKPTTVISGTARGVDKLGERWAVKNNIPLIKYPANWEKYGKRAGYLRNKEMAKVSETLLALWDGNSNGTRNMIDIAKQFNLLIHIFYCK